MKNLLIAAALGATALVPISVNAQTAQQQQMTQPGQMQPGQMQVTQIQQMPVAELMNREVISEQGQLIGTIAGIVQQEGAEPLVVIAMQQDQAQVLLPMDRVSMRGQQIVAEGAQNGQLMGAQQFDQQQQAQFQPVDEQQQVPVRMEQAQVQEQPMQPMQPGQPMQQQQMAVQPQLELEQGFVVRQGPDQILGSNLMNADVIGATGENIGNVDDVLLDDQGRVLAIVVGVGGFLGIGQRDVAIPVDALNFVTAQVAATGATQPTATGTLGAPATGKTALGYSLPL